MREPYNVRYFDTLGGINNSRADEYISDIELSAADNYEPDYLASGVLIGRDGITKESSAQTEKITSIYEGKTANWFSTLTTLRTLDGTSRQSGLTSTTNACWASFQDYDIFVNGSEYKKSSNGTSFTTVSNIPSGTKYVESYNNFLFGAGHARASLRWTNIGDAEDWPATNEFVFNQKEADDITGLKKNENSLMVFCARSFHHINGTGALDMSVVGSVFTDGCDGNRSITVIPGFGICWWSSRGSGIAVSSDGFAIDYPMVRKLQGTLSTVNFAQNAMVHSTHDPKRKRVMFWIFVNSSSTVNMRVDYYYLEDALYTHTGAGVQMPASGTIRRSGDPKIYVGMYGTSNVYVHEQTGVSDDGAAIAGYIETKREAQGGPSVLKIARDVTVSSSLTASETVTYGYYIDNATSTTATVSLTPGSGTVESYAGINRMHNKIKHRVATSTSTSRPRIFGIFHDGEIVRNRAA